MTVRDLCLEDTFGALETIKGGDPLNLAPRSLKILESRGSAPGRQRSSGHGAEGGLRP